MSVVIRCREVLLFVEFYYLALAGVLSWQSLSLLKSSRCRRFQLAVELTQSNVEEHC